MSPQFRPLTEGHTCKVEALSRNTTRKSTLTHPLLCLARHWGGGEVRRIGRSFQRPTDCYSNSDQAHSPSAPSRSSPGLYVTLASQYVVRNMTQTRTVPCLENIELQLKISLQVNPFVSAEINMFSWTIRFHVRLQSLVQNFAWNFCKKPILYVKK